MRASRWAGLLLVFAVVAHPLQASASTITDGGLNTGFGCEFGFQCGTPAGKFVYDPTAASGDSFDPATGTITLNTGTLLLDLSFSVASATFVDVAGADNGVDEIVFSNLSYFAINLPAFNLGGNVYEISGSVFVSGSYEQRLGGGTVVPLTNFAVNATVSAGQCTTQGGNQLVCTLDFGPGGPFELGIGSTPVNRRFIHGFTVISAPEPSTAMLMGGGLLGLLAIARRHRP